MAEKIWKPGEPLGDPALHLPVDVLEAELRSRPVDARDSGRVSLNVRRLDDGRRESLERIR